MGALLNKAKIVDLDGVVYETSVPPETEKKKIKYAKDWYFWKTQKKNFAYISILKWNKERMVYDETSMTHGDKE